MTDPNHRRLNHLVHEACDVGYILLIPRFILHWYPSNTLIQAFQPDPVVGPCIAEYPNKPATVKYR